MTESPESKEKTLAEYAALFESASKVESKFAKQIAEAFRSYPSSWDQANATLARLNASTALTAARTIEHARMPSPAGVEPNVEVQLKQIAASEKLGTMAHERFMADVGVVKESMSDNRWIERGVLVLCGLVVIIGLVIYGNSKDSTALSASVAGFAALLGYLAGRKAPRKPSAK